VRQVLSVAAFASAYILILSSILGSCL
jgi:hypothetical protein